MQQDVTVTFVEKLMLDFARDTGLEPESPEPRRYLWTDAFAVCNFLELYRRTSEEGYKDLALRLVGQVHHVLGRHRRDDERKGWISGLEDKEGELHPTAGGLRIGKPMNERRKDEPIDQELEWEQDGQYFHYLTKWMHALERVSKVTGDTAYLRWAMELAKAAHAGFTYPTHFGRKRMYWKMSIDLSYPLVPSMGQQDPLDGYVTYVELQTAAHGLGRRIETDLSLEIIDMAGICRGGVWVTDDPLGIGGLLSDAYRIAQLMKDGGIEKPNLLEKVIHSALLGLGCIAQSSSLSYPAQYRLAFRELGLSIGLKGARDLADMIGEETGSFNGKGSLVEGVGSLKAYLPLGEEIERFWSDKSNRTAATWVEHRDINAVMLATSLAPEAFLLI